MGGSTFSPNFCEKYPLIADDQIHFEDDFIRTHKFEMPGSVVQKLWYPFWRIRSEYHDTISPIEFNTVSVLGLRSDINAGCEALQDGVTDHPAIAIIVLEAAACYKLYFAYLLKLRRIRNYVQYIDRSIRLNKINILDEFATGVDFDPVACTNFVQHLIYSLEMSTVLKIALDESIETGKKVLCCSHENLLEMSKIYYQLDISLPTDPFCKSTMINHWVELGKIPELKKKRIAAKIQKAFSFGSRI